MFISVKDVKYLDDYRLRLTFSDGVIKDVDLSDELYGQIFEPLKDLSFFKQVKVSEELGTIFWPNDADFAPEFLYEIGTLADKVA